MAALDTIQYGPYADLRRKSALSPKTQGPGINSTPAINPNLVSYLAATAAQPTAQPTTQPTAYGQGAYSALTQDPSGSGTTSPDMGGQFGDMTKDERASLSTITGGPAGWAQSALGIDNPDGFLGGLMASGVRSAVNKGVSMGMETMGVPSPFGALGVMGSIVQGIESLKDKLGLNAVRGFSSPTEADMQSVTDTHGAYAGAAARAAAAQAASNWNNAITTEWGTPLAGHEFAGPTEPGGWVNGSPPSPSVGYQDNPNDPNPGGVSGPAGGWGNANPGSIGPGQAPGDARAAGETGSGAEGGGQNDGSRGGTDQSSDASGRGGGWARGGVSKVRRTSKATYGEEGPEDAIFIPQKGSKYDMTKPGLQGNEVQVLQGLLRALAQLGG
jgi:hypothetical protein